MSEPKTLEELLAWWKRGGCGWSKEDGWVADEMARRMRALDEYLTVWSEVNDLMRGYVAISDVRRILDGEKP